MKNLILILVAISGFTFSSYAQEKKNKNAKINIEVKGNCDRCKKRIEKAAYGVKGVKQASWHADDQMLHLILDERKATPKQVQEAVASVGHSTKYNQDEVATTQEQYEALHHCCKY